MAHKVRFANREFALPQSRLLRLGIGILLIIGGCLGFLPILGFWMIPLGLLVLSIDIPRVRRWRRRLVVWWHRRRRQRVSDRPSDQPAAQREAGFKPGDPVE
jgi:hypothetical protein